MFLSNHPDQLSLGVIYLQQWTRKSNTTMTSPIEPAQHNYEDGEGKPPHDALFLVLPYLPSLWELLSMSQVCVHLRDALFRDDDLLPWMELVVQNPLSRRLADHNLVRVASRAKGRLNILALFDCFKITDQGLLFVVRNNTLIQKLYVSRCTSLTPEGVINAVRILSSSSSLRCLRIDGLYNLTKEHLQTLHLYLPLAVHHPNFLHEHRRRNTSSQLMETSSIDVEVCPKCDQVRMVFICPKETCKNMTSEDGCRGCNFCIPRCVECGGCLEEEEESGICGDSLCLDCWLQLPKCNFCNRPYCKLHYQQLGINSQEEGFVCSSCTDNVIMGGGGSDSN